MSDRLDRDAAERVIRRAVELSEARADPGAGVEIDALLAAAGDIGVDPTSVYRAVAEEQAGLLADEPDGTRLERLEGPASVSAARVLACDERTAMSSVDEWLRKVWAFRRVRAQSHVAEYHRRTDAVAGLQRSARSLTGKENADKVKVLRVVSHRVDDHHSLVALVADLDASRTYAEVGGATVAASGTIVSVASALAWAPWAWLGIPASAAAGIGVLATRRAWTRGIDTELEGLLDRVEAGNRPESVLGGLTERFLGGSGGRPHRHPGP